MFRTAHIFVAGFTQRVGRSSNGVYRLFDECYRRFASQSTLVEYFPWYIHPQHIAELTAERDRECQHQSGSSLRVQIVGYSFGGQTAAHICDELDARSVGVEHLVLCDPVARYGRLGWLRAANPWSVIHVPRSVKSIDWFAQRHPRWQMSPPFFNPRGHRVDWAGGEVVERRVYHTHSNIDNAPAFHRAVMDAATVISGKGHCDAC